MAASEQTDARPFPASRALKETPRSALIAARAQPASARAPPGIAERRSDADARPLNGSAAATAERARAAANVFALRAAAKEPGADDEAAARAAPESAHV
jgi:hypothetical protein